MTDTTLFQETSKALFGTRWQSELARKIGKDDRTVRRYASGVSPIPDTVWETLRLLLTERGEEIADLKERVAALAVVS